MAGYIGGKAVNLSTSGADISGTANLDAVNIDGAVQIDATLSVGVNDTGYDVKFFGATASRHMTWDESADSLIISGDLDVNDGTIKLDGNYPVGTSNVALGDAALDSLTSGGYSTALGHNALTAQTTGNGNVGVGFASGLSTTSGIANVSVGTQALNFNTTASQNTAVGYQAGYTNTTGTRLSALGYKALFDNTTGGYLTGLGWGALVSNTTGSYNTAVGDSALLSNTTASYNTAISWQSLYSNTTGAGHVAVGTQALYSNTTATQNNAFGNDSLYSNTTGSYNVALGTSTLRSNTTAASNVAVGYQAGYSKTTAPESTMVGYQAGYNETTGGYNAFFGMKAGFALTTGTENTFVGRFSGSAITTGGKNSILGKFSGNQGSLDIRTSSNYIVLSDGDGNPRGYFSNVGALHIDKTPFGGGTGIYLNNTNSQAWIGMRFQTGGSTVGYISVGTSSTSYVTSSDYRLKENVVYDWDATTRLKQLKPARFNFIADADTTVDGFLAHEAQAVVPECATGTHNEVDDEGAAVMQGIDQSKLVPLLVKTIQELEARITALEGN